MFRPTNTLIVIGSGNGLAPVRRQAITWTNDGLLLTHLIPKEQA